MKGHTKVTPTRAVAGKPNGEKLREGHANACRRGRDLHGSSDVHLFAYPDLIGSQEKKAEFRIKWG